MAFIKNHLKQRIFTKNISEKIKIPPMNLKIQGISKNSDI